MIEKRVIAAAARPAREMPGRSLRWLADRSTGTSTTAALENVLPAGGFVPTHHHDIEELLVCLEGRGEIHIDGETHAFCAGDTAIVPPQRVHGFRNMTDATMRVIAFFPSAAPGVAWEDPRYGSYSWR